MNKTTYIVLWTITAINLIFIGYMLMQQPTKVECYSLPNAEVCVRTPK